MTVKGAYINLDRDETRRARVEAELARAGWNERFERFAAIDGHAAPRRPDLANRAELGCYLSHLDILRRHVGEEDWLHVVEDDVVISQYADQCLPSLLAQAEAQRCDLLFTNVLLPQESWVVGSFVRMFDQMVSTDAAGAVTGLKSVGVVPLERVDFLLTTSYLVNPAAIGRIADLLTRRLEDNPFPPIDLVYQRLARSGELKAMCAMPFLTAPRLGGASSIRDSLSPWRVSHLIMEMALYADRDVAELARVVAALEPIAQGGVTHDLIARAYRYAIGAEVDSTVSL